MWRPFVSALLVLVIFAGGLLAADGVFLRFANHDLIVKVRDKETTIDHKHLEVYGADGERLEGKAIGEALQEGTKLELTEKDGKVVKVKIKK
jgi:hypothetical protein